MNERLCLRRGVRWRIQCIKRRMMRFFAALTALFSAKTTMGNAASREVLNLQAEKLLNAYGAHILRLAYSYVKNMSDAEEILQDTLLQFLRAAPAFENQVHEKSWLLRVAGNLSKNRIKYNKMRHTDELNEALVADGREDLSFVWEAVKDLPVHYREVIHLFYYERYSTAQIASILQLKESTVRSKLNRGRMRLKEILQEAYDFA